jgi:5-methylcytosine-specific restriction protein A
MPDKPKGFCATKRCPNRVLSGHCEAHQRSRNQTRDTYRHSDEARALYRTERWKQMSLANLAEHPWCVRCAEKGIKRLAKVTDHIIAANHRPDLFFEPTNHRSACWACNAATRRYR